MSTLSVRLLRVVIGWLTVAGCSSSDKKDPLLLEAADYHNRATKIQAIMEPQLDRIDSLKAVLATQKSPNTQAVITTLNSLKTAFAEWEGNLIEVPGMPHNHAHEYGQGGHTHKHEDATLKDLPTDQMRDLQREMLTSIRQIQTRLNEVTHPTNNPHYYPQFHTTNAQ